MPDATDRRVSAAGRYCVYVVLLRDDVWENNPYRWQNLQRNPARPHFYVGSTGRTPEERFAAHMQGGRTASEWVHRYGVRLAPEIYADLPTFADRAAAERLEDEVAERLRRLGCGVACNAKALKLDRSA